MALVVRCAVMNASTSPQRPHPPYRYWFNATLLLAAATVGGYLLDHPVSLTSQAMLYVLAVVVASSFLNRASSMAFALLCVTIFNFLFVPPRWTFEVDSPANLVALSTMLMVALVISHLSTALRRETDIARRNEWRARQLQDLATALAGVADPEQALVLGQAALNTAFAGPCVLASRQADGALQWVGRAVPELEDGLQCCMREAAVLGPGTGRWPGLNAWYLPLGDRDHMHGAVCVQNVAAADTAGREHAQALCVLLAQTLWRLLLTTSMLAAQRESQRQQLQSTFLAAISHDLRTPLAAIVGAASSLQMQGDKLDAAERERLLGSVVSEARHLSNVTENTLQLVRLANATQDIRRDWESMEEIVGAVLARLRQRDPARRITSRVPVGLPLIRVDPVLIAQLIGNLLDNALKYSSDAVELVVTTAADAMQVSVKDRGQGIPEAQQQTIFEPYSRSDQSGQRGAGLGLAVCHAIATAHNGTLTYRRRQGGGSTFSLGLPLEPQPVEEALP